MMHKASAVADRISARWQSSTLWRFGVRLGIAIIVVALAVYNLSEYPLTWFDEGSHLHVPKTLVRFGVYADYSSEGFRHYGPTIGVGPTVMLPIAAVFRLFGIGLLQARLVMVLYLLGATYVFFRLARRLGGSPLAWVATALLITSRGVSFMRDGRQVLGEVPGLFFLIAGLGLWFDEWEKARWHRLALSGLLFGLAMITKYQYLLVLAPALGLAWIANLVYYRTTPQRVFILTGIVAACCFALWQVYMILYLGPATAGENLAMLRQFTSGAALVFSPELMQRGIKELLSLKVYLGWLPPVLAYGVFLALPRRREAQQWGFLYILISVNLIWYIVASISWLRYAFLGLCFASLFVAHFFRELTNGFQFDIKALWTSIRQSQPTLSKHALRLGMLAWLTAMIVLPLAQTAREIILPPFNAPKAMATYLDEHLPHDVLIETWEPEMGLLTDHNYHYPPQLLLNTAVGYKWYGGPSPADEYHFVQAQHPEYVLVGEFARWVDLYPPDLAREGYELVTSIGAYGLYARAR